MNRLEKVLLMGAAGLLAYKLVSRRRANVNLEHYYSGKVAVVTGGASGIGRAIVSNLYRLGANILAVDINSDALDKLADELPGVATMAIDLGGRDAPQRVINETLERFGRLDILFNNAGILFAGPFWEMSVEEMERVVEINFTMQIRMTRAALPYFMDRGSGVVAFTGSMSAYVYAPRLSVYAGTKGGLHNFVTSLRRELPRNGGVQLTIVHPLFTRTNLTEKSYFDAAESLMKLETPDEVALSFLRGIARGDRTVFVRASDQLYIWLERLLPTVADSEIRKMTELYPVKTGAPLKVKEV